MDNLAKLADALGIERSYLSLLGQREDASEAAIRAILAGMGVAAATEEEAAASLELVEPLRLGGMEAPDGPPCFLPDWLKGGRAWGVTCQLYALRSSRNWGMGDFEDLGRYAEIAASAGADFVGVNPLHALFLADPDWCSPFSPSNRQFLNPLYIAVDRVGGVDVDVFAPAPEVVADEFVQYRAVAAAKKQALEALFAAFRVAGDPDEQAAFAAFREAGGEALADHALFEALSEAMRDEGHGSGWHGWPDDYHDPRSDRVRAFDEEHADRVAFHAWLQWIAERQLAGAQERARAAGMRIGLYLDLAVGVSPDGSATWSDRRLTVREARIGAPPDYFNAAGQDWGLAPLSPATLAERDFEPYRQSMDAVLKNSGALRIDHAMSLYRLFWIASGFQASEGVYVRYPFPDLLRTLADVSRRRHAIIIGEDLGVVPEGFRDVMKAMQILVYRVFFFEKDGERFLPPESYPETALACVTTHDLHTLAGWWTGRDLELRGEVGWADDSETRAQLQLREHERRHLLGHLHANDLLPPEMERVMRAEETAPASLPTSVAVAIHRLVARTPSCLVAVPAEDLTGAVEQVNLPGTMGEHPNWRRKIAVDIEDLPASALFDALTAALRDERPRP